MPDFRKRSGEIEIMDDLNCTGKVLEQTLHELEIINKWLGGNNITIDALGNLLHQYPTGSEITIADLGCGSGDMLRIIDTWGRKKNLRLKLTGIDANPYIVSVAERKLIDRPHVQFLTLDIFSPEFHNQQFDIVIGTLFYHHFTTEQLVLLFDRLKQNVRIGFIINDIHRHWLAYYSIKLLTKWFSKSAMVKYDAPLSVARAFKKKDLLDMLAAAHIKKFSIQWRWAFRWRVIVKTNA